MLIIAAPYQEGKINPHFGQCTQFLILKIDNGSIIEEKVLKSPQLAHDHQRAAQALKSEGVQVVLAGGIGHHAYEALRQAGIEVVSGCTGNIKELALAYARGELRSRGVTCHEHQHKHQHHHGQGYGHGSGHCHCRCHCHH